MNEFFDADSVDEFNSLLSEVENSLLNLEDSYSQSDYNLLLRNLHSLKGNFGMLGELELGQVVHNWEAQIIKVSKEISANAEFISIQFKAIDLIKECLSNLVASQEITSQLKQLEDFFNDKPLAQKQESLIIEEVAKRKERKKISTTYNSPVPTYNGLNVYVIDDEPEMLEIIKFMLEDRQCTVTTFTDEQKIKEAVINSIPDLVITDFWMGSTNGVELLEAIHGFMPHIPCIMITGYVDDPSIYRRAMRAGAIAVTGKPIDTFELENLLTEVAERKIKLESLRKSFNIFESILNLSKDGSIELPEKLQKSIENEFILISKRFHKKLKF